jgi:hypothetical protein
MEDVQTITEDTAPADTSPDSDTSPTSDADMTAEMGQIFDAHNPGSDNEPSEHVDEVDSTESSADTEQPVETVESPTSVRMPQAWSKEQAEVWNSLTPDAQRYVAQRELEAQRRISELGHLAKQQPGIDDFGQQFESIRAQGLVPLGDDGQPLSAPQVVESALAFDQALRQNPAEAITALAQAHGLNLAELAGVQGSAADVEYLQQSYATLQQQVEQQRLAIQQQQQADYAAREAWLAGEIEKYTAGKEYWPSIESEVIHQTAVLRQANPSRAQLDPLGLLREAEQRALKVQGVDTDAKKRVAETKRKADQAKRIASLNVRSRAFSSASPAGQSWEETMAQAYDRATNHRR